MGRVVKLLKSVAEAKENRLKDDRKDFDNMQVSELKKRIMDKLAKEKAAAVDAGRLTQLETENKTLKKLHEEKDSAIADLEKRLAAAGAALKEKEISAAELEEDLLRLEGIIREVTGLTQKLRSHFPKTRQ